MIVKNFTVQKYKKIDATPMQKLERLKNWQLMITHQNTRNNPLVLIQLPYRFIMFQFRIQGIQQEQAISLLFWIRSMELCQLFLKGIFFVKKHQFFPNTIVLKGFFDITPIVGVTMYSIVCKGYPLSFLISITNNLIPFGAFNYAYKGFMFEKFID